jgi:hypothetical protein
MLKVATSHEAHRDDLPLTLGYSLYPLLSRTVNRSLLSTLLRLYLAGLSESRDYAHA